MKLSSRLRNTLLPVIFLTFLLAMMPLALRHQYQYYERVDTLVERELLSKYALLEQQITFHNEFTDHIVDGHEFRSLFRSTDLKQSFQQLNEHFSQEMRSAVVLGLGIEAIVLLGEDGIKSVSQFRPVHRDYSGMLADLESVIHSVDSSQFGQLHQTHTLFEDEGHLKLAVITAINVNDESKQLERSAQLNENHLHLVSIFPNEFLLRTSESFNHELTHVAVLQASPPPKANRTTIGQYHTEYDDARRRYTLTSHLVNLELVFPPQFHTAQLLPYQLLLLLMALLLSCISYFVASYLLRRHMIAPIELLTQKISENQGPLENIKDDGSEVSRLNIAFKQMLENIDELSSIDSLTHLTNREAFYLQLEQTLARFDHSRGIVALFFLDIHQFFRINELYGIHTGDKLLRAFADRLKLSIRYHDVVRTSISGTSLSRISGDQFAVALTDLKQPYKAAMFAERIIELMTKPFEVDEQIFELKMNIGIALFPIDADNAETLVDAAQTAMQAARQVNDSSYCFFTNEVGHQAAEFRNIELSLKAALFKEEYFLNFMPIYDCQHKQIVGCEVLLRTRNEFLTKVGTERFVSVAESTGFIFQIDIWVIETAFIKIARWREAYGFDGKVAINLSANELHQENFIALIIELLERYDVDPKKIELEVTETALIEHNPKSIGILHELKQLGFILSLDDFGTGYTAFNQLIYYPFDILKIDRSFVSDYHQGNDQALKMLNIMIELATLYDMEIVAEGVETEVQWRCLKKLKCHYMQGYYLSKPVDEATFLSLWQANKLHS